MEGRAAQGRMKSGGKCRMGRGADAHVSIVAVLVGGGRGLALLGSQMLHSPGQVHREQLGNRADANGQCSGETRRRPPEHVGGSYRVGCSHRNHFRLDGDGK